MSDRKWLNLVIFLISVMLLLFLIIDKNLNKQNPTIISKQFLIADNFNVVLLRINGRWLPIEQIQTEINSEQWTEFENAWKTFQASTIFNQQPEPQISSFEFTLVWDDGNSKISFKLSATNDALYVTNIKQSNVVYRFNLEKAKLLLPVWLINKTRIE